MSYSVFFQTSKRTLGARLGITNWLFGQPGLIRKIENDLSSVGLETDWTIN